MITIEKDLEETPIIPTKLIFQQKVFNITSIDSEFIIKKYDLFIDDSKNLVGVKLYARHPNCNPETNLFCLPENLVDQKFTKDIMIRLHELLPIFNLDSCYFVPWDKCTYKMEVN